MYAYIRSEPGLWTAGFYDPAGKWRPESDHDSEEAAAKRVYFLNGGTGREELARLRSLLAGIEQRAKALLDYFDGFRDRAPGETTDRDLREIRDLAALREEPE